VVKIGFVVVKTYPSSGGSTVVGHLTLHAKVRGSSRGATVVGEKEKLKVCLSICV